MADVDLWFDPSCPWTWVTSRWLVRAAGERDLTIRWHPLSLLVRNGEGHEEGHAQLRVLEAVREGEAGEEGVGRLYAEVGRRRYVDGDRDVDLGAALGAVGLDPSLASAADDDRYDGRIEASTEEARRLAGDDAGSPVLGLPDERVWFFGPILTGCPIPGDAGRLWDAFATMAASGVVTEMKRDRDRPDFASTA